MHQHVKDHKVRQDVLQQSCQDCMVNGTSPSHHVSPLRLYAKDSKGQDIMGLLPCMLAA